MQRETWDDLTPERQIAECERAAEALDRCRPSAGYAGDPFRLASFYRRLAAEIRASLPV